jgi:hypothetical protein
MVIPELFSFRCKTCGEIHDGLPDLGFDAPIYYAQIPENGRDERTFLNSDLCSIEDEDFFVRGCLEIPIKGRPEVFVWGVWVSLSKSNFLRYVEIYNASDISGERPFFGWLSNQLPYYPDTLNLKTMVYVRPHPRRPSIQLEPTDHPLSVHQREGIAVEELIEIIRRNRHGDN